MPGPPHPSQPMARVLARGATQIGAGRRGGLQPIANSNTGDGILNPTFGIGDFEGEMADFPKSITAGTIHAPRVNPPSRGEGYTPTENINPNRGHRGFPSGLSRAQEQQSYNPAGNPLRPGDDPQPVTGTQGIGSLYHQAVQIARQSRYRHAQIPGALGGGEGYINRYWGRHVQSNMPVLFPREGEVVTPGYEEASEMLRSNTGRFAGASPQWRRQYTEIRTNPPAASMNIALATGRNSWGAGTERLIATGLTWAGGRINSEHAQLLPQRHGLGLENINRWSTRVGGIIAQQSETPNNPLLYSTGLASVATELPLWANGINLLTGVPTAMGAGAPYNRRGIIQGGGLIAGLHIESQPGYPRRAVSALHGFANAPKGTRISGNASTGFQFHAPSN